MVERASKDVLDQLQKITHELRRVNLLIEEMRNADHKSAFAEDVLKEIQKTSPRVKSLKTAKTRAKKMEISNGVFLYAKMKEEFYQKVGEEYSKLLDERKKANKERDALLATMEPLPGKKWHSVETVWLSTYRSQGWGAKTYAKASAETRLEYLQNGSPSIEFRLRYDGELEEYGIEAKVASDLDTGIVRQRMKTNGLREMVRSYWAKGTNPRVYLPGLPHGYEEENGLDFFGNDLRKEK